MSLSRIFKLLGKTSAPAYYEALSGGKEEAPAVSALVADAEQQAKILEHFENKLNAAHEAFNNLQQEIEAIDKEPDVLEHMRVTAIFHRVGHPASLQTAQDEMRSCPILLQCYNNFHVYLQNAMTCKNQVENCLNSKPALKNDRIQDLYNQLNKKYKDYKKTHNLDEKLATYMGYDKIVADIITHCKQNTTLEVKAVSPRPA